jgi:CheY-like chemotaxis protein
MAMHLDMPVHQPSSQPARGLRVLLVEDDPDQLALWSTALLRAGAEVLAAGSATQALDLLLGYAKVVHVLVCDMVLPDMDGNALLRKIHELPEPRSNVAALAVTGMRSEDGVDEAHRSGFHVHAAKPIASSDLVGLVVALGELALEEETA